jgi:ribonuclease HII
MRHAGIATSIRFQVHGDSLFPPAAASMVAKWARESLMERFNGYWREVVGPGLKPTAGYAVDAARFTRDIEPWITKLAIEKNQWWRQK